MKLNIIYVSLISIIKSWLRKTVQCMEPQAVNPWFQGVYRIGFVQKIRFPCCLIPTVRHHWPLGDTGTCFCITNIKYSADFFLSACSHCCSLKRWTNTCFRIFTKWVSCLYILPMVFMAQPHSWQNASLHFGEKRMKPLPSNSLALREVWSVNCFLI